MECPNCGGELRYVGNQGSLDYWHCVNIYVSCGKSLWSTKETIGSTDEHINDRCALLPSETDPYLAPYEDFLNGLSMETKGE